MHEAETPTEPSPLQCQSRSSGSKPSAQSVASPSAQNYESLVLSSIKLMPTFDGSYLKEQDNSHFDSPANPSRYVDKYVRKARLLDWHQVHITKYFQLCLRGRAEHWYEQKFRKLNLLKLSDEAEAERLWKQISSEFIAAFDPKRNRKLLQQFYDLEQDESDEVEAFLRKLDVLIDAIEPELPREAKVLIAMSKLRPDVYGKLIGNAEWPVDYEDLIRKATLLDNKANEATESQQDVRQEKEFPTNSKMKPTKPRNGGKQRRVNRNKRIKDNIANRPLG